MWLKLPLMHRSCDSPRMKSNGVNFTHIFGIPNPVLLIVQLQWLYNEGKSSFMPK